MLGYAGKLLRVDLTNMKPVDEDLDPGLARSFIGGRGLGVSILFRELSKGIDPLSAGNKLVFAVGPFEGTALPGGSRLTVTAKSPLTGLLGDSDFGGCFPLELKRAGYDAVIIEGRAERPVYLWLDGRKPELRSATHIWGRDTLAAQEAILADIGRWDARVVTIGPAAERLVRYACIVSEGRFFAGRSGLGAVMASKNLKGVAVKGSRAPRVARPDKLKTLVRDLNRELRTGGTCDSLSKYGTWNTTAPANINGVMPVKNFQEAGFAEISRIDGDAMLRTIYAGNGSCPGCPIACRRVVKCDGAHAVSADVGGPQYETVAAFGSLLLNSDPIVIAKANELCNLHGLDTISTGVCVAFAMECYERGLLSETDVGFRLEWGDPQAILRLIDLIATRQGIGDLLAEGVKRAAGRVGKGSQAWAMHVKGMELPMHDPRGKKGQALSYATSMKGADHMESFHDETFQRPDVLPALGLTAPMSRKSFEGKARLVKVSQDYWGALADSLVACKLPLIPPRPFTPERVVAAVNYITGWDVSLDELMRAGERVYNLGRAFAVEEIQTVGHADEKLATERQGLGLAAAQAPASQLGDRLPGRFAETLEQGGSAGERIDPEEFHEALLQYYHERGWTDDGVPTPRKLDELGLGGAVRRSG